MLHRDKMQYTKKPTESFKSLLLVVTSGIIYIFEPPNDQL
ncbi:MAG: hypothetical protein RLZZ529_317 [Bacteroidota bacterium]|jgi:hypothetical protein